MTVLQWDQIGDRVFESGVDRGVLYFPEGGGVAWNGIISVSESPNATVRPVYFDGVKSDDIVTPGDWAGTLNAYTYPEEFLRFEGVLEDQSGFWVADQPNLTFGLSYRTKVGDDVLGLDLGYKIHLLYNLTAIPSAKAYATLTVDPTPINFSWSLSSIPENIDGYRPTAHVIIDSRTMDPYLLQDVEDLLYGDEDGVPTLPPLKGFHAFVRNWNRLIITDNLDGTWTAESRTDGYITMLSDTEFEITTDSAEYLDAVTYEISSSEKNEDDIWLP